jgi:hypothetical protein
MKFKASPILLRALLILLLFASFSKATAAQEARVVEQLPGGEYIIEVGGKQLRAITPDHAREIAARKVELERAKEESGLLTQEIAKLKDALGLAKKDALLADAMAKLEGERSAKFQVMFDGEHALRLQAEQLARGNRVTRFFDNPFTQIATKVVWQGVQTWLSARR